MMTVLELIVESQTTLQDSDANYWSQAELLGYYNNGIKSLAAERLEEPKTTTVPSIDDTYTYTVSGVLRYISATDSNNIERKLYPDDGSGDEDTFGIVIKDYNEIYVNTPETGVSIDIKHIAIPSVAVDSDTVRYGDDVALKYYIVSKAYEKESDLENFQKAQYFFSKYSQELVRLLKSSKLGYIDKTETTVGYYY